MVVPTPQYNSLSAYQRQCLPATNLQREMNGWPLIDVPADDVNYWQYFNAKIEPLNAAIVIRPINPVFTYFKAPIKNVAPYKDVTLLQVYEVINNPKYFKDRTDHIRSLPAKSKEQNIYKATAFDYVCFSGTFDKRANDNLLKHSGLLCIDFDGNDPAPLRQRILSDDNIDTDLLFTSPRGNGLKWVTSIDLTAGIHLEHFFALQSYFSDRYGIDVDESCKDISRACFLSYDPEVFINSKYGRSAI